MHHSTHSFAPSDDDPFLTKDLIDGQNRPLLMLNGTHPNFAVVHLQRLADPRTTLMRISTVMEIRQR